ncbi:MAG: hypothetical protein KA419_20450 [Acidobacteria bacterium]|nr:hypothetical protein [Acidobacteriota bacterium]
MSAIWLGFLLALAAAPPPAGIPWEGQVASEPGTCVVLWDLQAGSTVCAGDTALLDRRVPAGSWMKLFLAYALAAAEPASPSLRFPCRGWGDPSHRCWLKDGHGSPDMAGALALSCNAWFGQAEERLSPETFHGHIAPFWNGKLPAPPAAENALRAWRAAFFRGDLAACSPVFRDLAAAVASLVLDRPVTLYGPADRAAFRSGDPPLPVGDPAAVSLIRRGMAASAATGTSRLFREAFGKDDLWAKTSSTTRRRSGGRPGDAVCMLCGFYPAGSPRAAVFLFVPRGFGPSKAAPLAGRIFRDFCTRRRLY